MGNWEILDASIEEAFGVGTLLDWVPLALSPSLIMDHRLLCTGLICKCIHAFGYGMEHSIRVKGVLVHGTCRVCLGEHGR